MFSGEVHSSKIFASLKLVIPVQQRRCFLSVTWTERAHEEAQQGLASERPRWCFELDEKYVYCILGRVSYEVLQIY